MATRRYADIKFVYDIDFPDHAVVIRQRVYKTPDDGIPQTPITALLRAREVPGDTVAPRAKPIEPRHVESCFRNPDNQSGTSIFKSFIPYRATDADHRGHVAEIKAFPGVESISYRGEVHTTTVKPYL